MNKKNINDNIKKNKVVLLEALKLSLGNVSEACRKTNLSRSAFYEYCNSDTDFKQAVEDIEESNIDLVESKLFERINGVSIGKTNKDGELNIYELPPDNTSIIFYLKCKAKKRGYIDRQEVNVNAQDLTDLITIKTTNE